MKKLLALCLSVCMVLTFIPTTFAEAVNPERVTVATGKTVRLEGESYPIYKVNPTSGSETDASVFEADMSDFVKTSGEYTYMDFSAQEAGLTGAGAAWVDMPITIEKEGNYEITYRVEGTASTGYAYMKYRIDGVSKGEVSGRNTNVASYVEYTVVEWLSAGEHSVGVYNKANVAGSNTYMDNGIDYIEIKPYQDSSIVNIPAGESVTIQAEDYRGVKIGDQEELLSSTTDTTTGDVWIYHGSGVGKDAILDIPVNIEQAGYYKFTYRIGKSYQVGSATLESWGRLGGTNVVKATETITTTKIDTVDKLTVVEFIKYVDAGETSVGVYAQGNIGNYHPFGADYIRIEPYSNPGAVSVAYGKSVSLEGEDYRLVTFYNTADDETTLVVDVVTEGDAKWIKSGSNPTYKHAKLAMPVNIENAGIYKITYRIRSSYNGCPTYAQIDGANIYRMGEIGSPNTGLAENLATYEYTTYLPAGETSVGILAEGNTAKYHMFAVDYIKVESMVPVIDSDDNEVLVEAESYPVCYIDANGTGEFAANDAKNSIRANEGVSSGDAYLRLSLGSMPEAYYELPVVVEEEGDYIVEIRATKNNANSLKNGRFVVNGAETELLVSGNAEDFAIFQIPAHFTKGTNTIKYIGETAGSYFYLFIDYIKFTKAVKADISATDNTVIEAENYGVNWIKDGNTTVYPVMITKDAALSGGECLGVPRHLAIGSGNVTNQLSIPVYAHKDGVYKVTTKVYHKIASTSKYTLSIDGASKGSLETGAAEDSWKETTLSVYLTKGDHTLVINNNGNALATNTCAFAVDSIVINPPATPVEINATGSVRIEAENYPATMVTVETGETVFADMTVTSDVTASPEGENGKYLGRIASPSIGRGNNYELRVEIDVKEAGYYKVTPDVYWNRTDKTSFYSVWVDGEKNCDLTAPGSSSWTQESSKIYFGKGVHVLAIRCNGNGASNAGNYTCFAVDCIDVESCIVPAVSISAEGKTRIEAETQNLFVTTIADDTRVLAEIYKKDFAIGEDESASPDGAGKYIGTKANPTITSDNVMQLEIKLDVATKGKYKITPSVYYNGGLNVSHYNLYVNGENKGALGIEANTWKETAITVTLEEGENVVVIQGTGNWYSNQGNTSNYICYAVDYVDVEADIAKIAATGTTTIEAEDYPVLYGDADGSGNYVFIDGSTSVADGAVKAGLSAYTNGYYELTVIAPETAEYVIESRAVHNQLYGLKNGRFAVNGETTGYVPSVEVDGVFGIYKFTATLNEGVNTIRFMGSKALNTMQIYVDYFKFTKETASFEVSSTEATRIEGENLTIDQTLVYDENGDNLVDKFVTSPYPAEVVEDAELSGGKYLTTNGLQLLESGLSGPYTTMDIPVTVAEKGRYNVASKLNWMFSGDVCISSYTLLVDGTVVDDYAFPDTAGWGLCESVIELTEGEHTITIRSCAKHNGTNKHAAMAVDYVEFSPAPAENGYVYDSASADADVTVTTDVAGDVVIALYDVSGKLVGIDVVEGAEATTHERTVACSDVPASCKVFVWNISTVAPLASHIDVPVK